MAITPSAVGRNGLNTSLSAAPGDPTHIEVPHPYLIRVIGRNTSGSSSTINLRKYGDPLYRTAESVSQLSFTIAAGGFIFLSVHLEQSRHIIDETTDPPQITFEGSDVTGMDFLTYFFDN